jgi:hypothetical protein
MSPFSQFVEYRRTGALFNANRLCPFVVYARCV